MTAWMFEEEKSKVSLKFQALVTGRWKPRACLKEVGDREQDMADLASGLKI